MYRCFLEGSYLKIEITCKLQSYLHETLSNKINLPKQFNAFGQYQNLLKKI